MKKAFAYIIFLPVILHAWQPITPPGTAFDDRLAHTTVYVGDMGHEGIIYMIGGSSDGQPGNNLALVYRYVAYDDYWETNLTPMPEARGWIQGAYWNKKIYVMGGETNSGQPSKTCYIYDIVSDSWSQGADMPRATMAHGAVACNGSIYIIGGLDSTLTQGTTNVTRYDISEPQDIVCGDSWSDATPLPEQFDMGGVTFVDFAFFLNTIFIIGGYNRGAGQCWTNVLTGEISESNPDSITWTTRTALPVPVAMNSACANQWNCFLLGGFENLSTPSNTFYQYETAYDRFYIIGSYPVTIARGDYLTGIRNYWWEGVICLAGDAFGDWGPPNDYYYDDKWAGIKEEDISQNIKRDLYATILRGPLVLPKDKNCRVFDITGRVVAPDKIKPGIYFIEVEGVVTQKVIKIR